MKSDWQLVLADCEARTRHTQPKVADMLRDLRHEMRESSDDYKPTTKNWGSAKTVCPGCGYPWSDHVWGEQGSSVCEPKNDPA